MSLIAERFKELKSKKEILEEQLNYYEKLNEQHRPVTINRGTLAKYRTEMETVFFGGPTQEQREFLKQFIDKISASSKGIKVSYFSGGMKP